ncbi:hypothetical protein AB0904_07330 [Streptomyces sp. NPDC006684]|uniref:hypothetical protein n=1 Tax=Streptomyces sp. NPDC006684 TaxID=3154477 RepID=UPI0034515D01
MTVPAALLAALVDDAGLFPPTALPMDRALARHRADLAAAHPLHTHRFLVPASRLGELRARLEPGDSLALGLVADRGAERLAADCAAVAADPRLRLALVEVPLAAFPGGVREALDALPGDVPVYAEPAARAAYEPLLTELGALERPVGAKLRCGGVRAELFPTAPEVAAWIVACARAGVPFKATAGLHEAVRHTAPATGFRHHGYLNLLLATAAAAGGATTGEVTAVLETEDAARLARRAHALGEAGAWAARRLLVSYGSCSTSTPLRQAADLLGTPDTYQEIPV